MTVLIGARDCYDKWRIRLSQAVLAAPQEENTILSSDLSEVFETVHYKKRSIRLIFDTTETMITWGQLCSEVTTFLAGCKRRIILGQDSGYYYWGTLAFNAAGSSESLQQLVITGEVEPYRYERVSSLEPWLWDCFHLKEGVIRDYRDLVVKEQRALMIPGSPKRIVPLFYTETAMTVEYRNKRYLLAQGINKIYEIWLAAGENQLTFYGNGTVSVDYRGARL